MTKMISMTPKDEPPIEDLFGERSPGSLCRQYQVLGGDFEFRSDSHELLALVDVAYKGLPICMRGDRPRFQIELRLTEGASLAGLEEPPAPRMIGGAGIMGVVMDTANMALAVPASRCGLVAISRELLRFPYHARYELIEFVVFTLASRAQGLMPLHAACVGTRGRGALLIGQSGAGKSTLALQCMLRGLDFLTEDAAFVAPQSLMTTGVTNFLHLRFDALAFLHDDASLDLKARFSNSPVIVRRSGEQKYEIDLRQDWATLAQEPLTLAHIVFVTKEPAREAGLLIRLESDQARSRLLSSQPYAAHQPGWPLFLEQASRLHAYVLRRGAHPQEAADTLRALLEGHFIS